MFDVIDNAEEYDYFIKFFDMDLIQIISNEANRYYSFCIRDQNGVTRNQSVG